MVCVWIESKTRHSEVCSRECVPEQAYRLLFLYPSREDNERNVGTMLVIIEINGKQYQVEEGRFVTVDRLPQGKDEILEIGNVLMVVDGERSIVGAPFIEGAKVRGRVLSHERGPKVLVYKMRCKKGYRRKNGHRQDLTRVQIEGVEFPGRAAVAAQ